MNVDRKSLNYLLKLLVVVETDLENYSNSWIRSVFRFIQKDWPNVATSDLTKIISPEPFGFRSVSVIVDVLSKNFFVLPC